MKSAWLKFRVDEEDVAVLKSVAETLGLGVSDTIRFLAREKQRELGKSGPVPVAGGKKRRATSS